jgi:hypothetical protein
MTAQSTGLASSVCVAELSVSSSKISGDRSLSSVHETSRQVFAWVRGVASLAVALLLLSAICAPAQAQTLAGNWNQESPATSPSARWQSSMDYDAAQGQVVLFGGYNETEIGDTWLWNGTTWTQQSPATSPPARSQSAMVYDAAQSNVVLFGGYLSNTAPFRSNDTWVWNGSTWTQQSPATSPSARADHAMAYDAAQSQVVLFGGFTDSGTTLGDTWTWDGTTWTQQNPATSPSARSFAAMAYDAIHNQVVMFGGQPTGTGGALNDTWVWNGTTWTQESPANSPPARNGHTMAFDAQTGQIVLFGGENANNIYLNDTWVWDGTNWTQESPAASPAARAFHNAAYDAAQGQVVVFGGLAPFPVSDTWAWSNPGNFGIVNVCPSGQSTPAACSSTLTLTYNVATTTTFGTTQVVTQGAPNLDFTLASGSTCTSTISAGGTCTVNVKFAPLAPGLRMGAAQLFDNSGNLLVSTPVYGVGQGPVVAFGLGTQTTVNTGSFSLSNPAGAVVDAAGNLYISDNGNQRVVKIAANGTQTTVGFNLQYPQGLAVDGAGDVFIADNNQNSVFEVPAGCTNSSCQITVGGGLVAQLGVAVDGAGDLFIGDFTGSQVVEVPANGGPQIVLYSPGSSSNPVGLALDSAGDLFIADFGLKQVVEIPPGCTSSACQKTVGTNWVAPEAVAVDAAGDVFVADEAPFVVEVPAGCGSISCQITVSSVLAYGLAVDAMGDIFIPELHGNQVIELNRSKPTSVTFPTATNVGSRDTTDGAMLVPLQNVGNATLNFAIPASGNNPSIGPDFSLFSSGQDACPIIAASSSAPGTLAQGDQCVYSIAFYPMIAGNPLSESLVLTDNNFNAIYPGPAGTQTMALSGVGVAASYTIGGTVSGLTGSGLVLQDNLGNNLSIISNGAFAFSGSLATNSPYSVTVLTPPSNPVQVCTVTNGGGTVAAANITTVVVGCVTVAYRLTVTDVGTGSGTVVDNLGQISCSGGTCSGIYLGGTFVTLTASASGNSIFVGWGDACASAGANSSCNLTMTSALNVSASFVAPGASQSGILKPITAGVVYGQSGSFTTNTDNKGGVSANSLADPTGSVLDSNGNLYVGDTGNNRVLFYPRGSTTPTRVYGQGGSFTSNGNNEGGISANSLNNPYAVALDSSGNLYVADLLNSRVLFYPSGSTTATRVYGQNGSFTTNAANNGGISANNLNNPWGVTLDSSGNLYVADSGNNRVLFYPAGSTTATAVYGQEGSFTTGAANNGGISANSLYEPLGMILDGSGNLYVADEKNNRVLVYPFGSTTATQIYGQGGSFTSGNANNGGVSANSLYQPFDVSLDSSGDLYLADTFNHRVLFYPFGSTTATRVYGQLGSFTTNSPNPGGVSANSLEYPEGVPLDSSGNLYVADYGNNRVVEYGSFGNVNVCPTGQSTPAPCNRTVTMSYYAAPATTFGAIEVVTQGVPNLDFTLGSGSTCTGTNSAGGFCTVNVNFAPLAPGLRMGDVHLFDNNSNLLASTPAYGVGQAPESAFGPATTYSTPFSAQSKISYSNQVTQLPNMASPGGGLTTDAAGNLYQVSNQLGLVKVVAGGIPTAVAGGFTNPEGLAIDGAGNFYVADQGLGTYGEVVKLAPGCASPSCASVVYAASASPGPYGVAVDGSGDVFISGSAIGAFEIPAGCSTSTCRIPLYSPASGSTAAGVAVDATGDVFVADNGLQQVVEIPAGCTSAQCQTTVGSGWVAPLGVAVDPAGDVLVADFELTIGTQTGAGGLVEVPAGCTNSNCQILLLTAGAPDPLAVAVSATGQVFAATDGPFFEINQSLVPSLSFALTSQGGTSSDSPQSVTVQNIGNQPLTVALSPIPDSNFLETSLSDCGSAFTLAAGAICYENFSFTPQATGYLTDVAYFSDNSLNIASSVVAQAVNLNGVGNIAGQAATTIVPDVVGMTQAAATSAIGGAGLALGSVSSSYSGGEPAGSVIGENPAAGTQVIPGSPVKLLISIGEAPPPTPNPLTFENNYFVTGDYASAGVTLRGTGVNGMATGTITIPSGVSAGAVPSGADIVDAFLYWQTVENTPTPSANTGTFLGYSITGQQIGSDLPYTDPTTLLSGTLRAYRADVNTYIPIGANGTRFASGSFSVSLRDGGSALPLTEGASLVVIYRALVAPGSTNPASLPLKAVVIYDGSVTTSASTTQNMQGFYDSVGTGENTALYSAGGWSNNTSSVTPGTQSSQYTAPLNSGNAYVAEILSTPVINSDNDGILDSWKAGPAAGDFFAGQPGYYDVKTQSWVGLPGALHGEKDLFVQLDWMCGAVLSNGSCDPTQENLFPSPDANGNNPLTMVKQAFAATGIALHLEIGNAVPESTCTDNPSTTPPTLCQFPGQPGVIGWKNSLEFSKAWPRNFTSCVSGGDCTPRFPYGQKDSYHYVLFGHSLTIPAWNTRFGNLTGIQVVANGTTTITTTGIPACPSRITISGVLGSPSLNGVYNTTGCTSTTMTVATPSGVPNWTYPNTLPEPVIGITSGTVTSISGYSDLGGADSAVTLALWETAPNQNMSTRANVIAGTLFHEIGHTLGLSHGGLYYQTPSSYIPTFDVNCKPNYQSSMNYLFQLDGVGPNAAVAYSNQQLDGEPQGGPPAILNEGSLSGVTQLTDGSGNPATFSTSAWYTSAPPSSTASKAMLHCDGTPLAGDTGYRVNGSIAPITPAWTSGQNIAFDGVPYSTLAGYNDFANIDLRQVGATGGEFAALASVLSFGSSATPLSVQAGGNVTLGSGGTVALGSGGTVTLGSGGNVTLGSGGTITPGNGGSVTLNNGGSVALSSGGTITFGSGGNVTLGSGGNVTLGSGGTITLGSGGNVTLGSGGNVTLGSGGTITAGGIQVTVPSSGGIYTIPAGGGTIALGSGGTIALGSGGNVTLGSGGTIALGSGGTVALGSGGNVTLGSGGTIALGSGGTVTLGSGGNVTLGSGGTIALGSGGNVTLGSGGNVTLGSGGNVTLGSGGNVTLGSGGNVTLGSGGTVTLGSGGNVTLGSGGTVTLGSGGNITLGSGGTIALGSGGVITMGSGGNITLGSGGGLINGVQQPAGNYSVSSGGTITLGSGGTVALGSGGNVTLGSGGNVTLGSGGNITLGSGGTVTLGSGGNVTLGSGGVVALGSGGTIALGSGGTIALGSGGNITLGSGSVTTTELDYDTANSVVRPPPSATYTQAPVGVNVTWMPPAFGVVATYTISRAVSPGTPVVIGSVSGVGGNPPATTFTDTTPPAGTLVYTIATTLVPDPSGSQRQSPPSPPAVLTINQNIVLGALPSSVTLPGPQTVTATAESNGIANGLPANISATGPCSIASQSTNPTTGVTSASVTLSSTGSCSITASQAGASEYNAASPVSGAFTILPQGSSTTSQTITFAPLQSVQYGSPFSLSATSSAGLAVTFTASGPCTTNGTTSGTTTGVGVCKITASAPANSSYSAASASQSFNINPAVLSVTANNLTSPYGHSLPSLTSVLSGFVNNDSTSVVSGAAALSTTATSTSAVGSYPITVATGTLAAANYTFLFGNGTLAIQPAAATISINNIPASPAFGRSFVPTYLYSGNGSPTESVASSTPSVCTVSGGAVSFVGIGTCTLTASAAATTDYSAVTGSPQGFTVGQAAATISINNIPASPAFGGSFVPTYLYSGTGSPTESVASSTSAVCTVSGGVVSFVGIGTCTLTASATATTDDLAVTGNPQGFTVGKGAQTVTFTQPASPVIYGVSPITLMATSTANLPVGFSVDASSIGTATISGSKLTVTGAGTLVIDANQTGNTDYQPAAQVQRTILVNQAAQTITFTTNAPASAAYNSTFTVAATGGASGNPVTFTSSGACSNSGATYTMTNSTGTCSVIARQAGNANYSIASTVTQTVNATGPLLTVSPSNINFGTVYLGSITTENITVTNIGTAAATINEPILSIVQGGNSEEFVAVSLCPKSLAAGKNCTITIAFVAGPYYTPQTATLEIMDNAPGSPQPVTLSAKVFIPQTITFTTTPPASAAYKSSFTVAATGGASGNPVTFTSSGACSNSGATYTMTSGTGTCSVIANQAGNSNYAAATQVTKTATATVVAQTIAFTTNPPASAAYKSSFTVAATGGASGNTVTFTSSGPCSNSGATYTMTSGTGTCSVIANQAGNSNYAAATQVTKTATAAMVAQTITFTTNPPASDVYKSSFTVAATGGASGNPVTFTSSGSCKNSGATYTITSTTGTCSVIANQAGNSNFTAAPTVTKTVNAT